MPREPPPPLPVVSVVRSLSAGSRLSLGSLFRAMRTGIGGVSGERVIIEFQQLTAESPGEGGSPQPGVLRLRARLDRADGGLDWAEVSIEAPPAVRWLRFRRDGGAGYAYSVDEGRGWGRFQGSPRIFDVGEFELALDGVAVDDVSFETVPPGRWEGEAEEGSPAGAVGAALRSLPVQALDVTLGRAAFRRLLRVFAADVGEGEGEGEDEGEGRGEGQDPLALSAFSVSIVAAEDVSLHCWWSLRGPGTRPSSPHPGQPGRVRVTCSVAVRVAPLPTPAPEEEVVVDDSLPLVGRVDDVWDLLRRA